MLERLRTLWKELDSLRKEVSSVKTERISKKSTRSKAEENAYLKEAIECARHDFYRASVVLGWCAATDRIHRTIEKVGFAKFNIASATMASQTAGRFKKFNTVQNVSSLSEIREVFDTLILWVIEGMGLIEPVASDDRRRPYRLTAFGATALSEGRDCEVRIW